MPKQLIHIYTYDREVVVYEPDFMLTERQIDSLTKDTLINVLCAQNSAILDGIKWNKIKYIKIITEIMFK